MILNYIFEKSAMLSNAMYDTITKEMSVTFANGKEYTYVDVEAELYDTLITSKSAGGYFNSIKKELKQK